MGAERILYVTQEKLVVWTGRRGVVEEGESFSNTEDGVLAFSRFLERAPGQRVRILADVIEEEFALASIPTLPRRDRNALLERRLSRKYSRTPFRLAKLHRSQTSPDGEQRVVFCALSNDELLNPWLEALDAQRTPLAGITSVPLLAQRVLAQVKKSKGNVMLLSQHQGDRLRLAYLSDGNLIAARLSQTPGIDADDYPQRALGEVQKSRRYLERTRLLRADERVDVVFVTAEDVAERIRRAPQDTAIRLRFVTPDAAAKALGVRAAPPADRLETLYVMAACRFANVGDYADERMTRDDRLHRLRRAAVGTLAAGTVAAAVATGVAVSTVFEVGHAVATMGQQTEQMEQTFRREHEDFAASQAESHEMKAAVDIGDFILKNRVPAELVMRELGSVLRDFPALHIAELTWRVEDGAEDVPRRTAQERVELRAPTELVAELYGEVVPFDGDLRQAFAQIERLVAELRRRSAFADVQATEYPVDVRPQSSVSGELVGASAGQAAPFRLRLRMLPQSGTEADDRA